jgi:hypothetical protein
MNNMQTKLVSELQRGFSLLDDSIVINLSSVRDILYGVEGNLNDYSVKNGVSGPAPIITTQDISTKLDQYNTTGTIIMGGIPGIAVPGGSGGSGGSAQTPVQATAAQT